MTMRNTIAALTVLAALVGCSHIARDETQYREDTQSLLQTRSAQVKSCYDSLLATDPSVGGVVTVSFVVEKKSGTVTNVAVVPEETKAPGSLQTCVTRALDGLVLTPEDRHAGEATFSWSFKPGAPAVVEEVE